MRVRKLTFTALAVAAALSLTACQNEDGGKPQSVAASKSDASSSDGGSDSEGSEQGDGKKPAGTSPAGKSSPQPNAAGADSDGSDAVGQCRTDDLLITADDATISDDAEGTVAVELKNTGDQSCTMRGFAGVDLQTGAGALSATRNGEPAEQFVLAIGKSVYFGITYPKNDSGGSGTTVTGLEVTPPNETKSVTLDWPGTGSLPVTDGAGSPVKLGPLGSAGQGG
jgi:predicted small secreted protein